ncbi:DUF3017 domain-containing protein [Schaalia cardiffensis]|nr:DUF3017 domain-containing protein [Schaalia cardiffensis]
MSETPASSTGGSWWSWATLAMVIVGVCGAVLLAALNHPHRAVLLLVATLEGLAVARLVIPGRPWFSSRSKWMDVTFFGGVGLLIWYFAPYTATVGIVSSTALPL